MNDDKLLHWSISNQCGTMLLYIMRRHIYIFVYLYFQIFNLKVVSTADTFFLFNTYFTSVVQQPYGYNVTGQLQEPKDLIRPATAKIVFIIL
jgi:hypothetical protein